MENGNVSQVSATFGEIALGLGNDGRDRMQLCAEFIYFFSRNRNGRVREPREEIEIETGVPRPWLDHAVMEVQVIQLGAYQHPVHFSLDRPTRGINRVQAIHQLTQLVFAGFNGSGREVVSSIFHALFPQLQVVLVDFEQTFPAVLLPGAKS